MAISPEQSGFLRQEQFLPQQDPLSQLKKYRLENYNQDGGRKYISDIVKAYGTENISEDLIEQTISPGFTHLLSKSFRETNCYPQQKLGQLIGVIVYKEHLGIVYGSEEANVENEQKDRSYMPVMAKLDSVTNNLITKICGEDPKDEGYKTLLYYSLVSGTRNLRKKMDTFPEKDDTIDYDQLKKVVNTIKLNHLPNWK